MIDVVAAYLRGDPIVGSGPTIKSRASLLADAATLARELPPARAGSHVLVVCQHDAYAFLVALLAAWQSDHAVALPPDHQRETTASILAREETVALMHDTGAGRPIQIGLALANATESHVSELALVVPTDRLAATHFERNDAGNLVPRSITHGQLLERVDESVRAEPWHPGTRVATTVLPACHDGLAMGLLAVLRCGARIERRMGPGPDSLCTIATESIDGLLTAPCHWRRLTRQYPAAANAIAQRRVLEPRRDAENPTGDAETNSLRILGSTLSELECVADVGIVTVTARAEPRQTLIAVELMLGAADDALDSVRARVSGHPNADIRVVAALDRDARGELDRVATLRRFGRQPDGSALNRQLDWGSREEHPGGTGTEHRFSVHVPHDYAWYQGHFPGHPIMAGVVQLHELVLPCVRQQWPEREDPTQYSRMKFTNRISPGDEIVVVVRARPDDSAIEFELRRGKTVCSGGRLHFPEASP